MSIVFTQYREAAIKTSILLLGVCVAVLSARCAQDSAGPLDADGDGIPTSLESQGDTDGDGLPDYLDRDSDNDLLADGVQDANHNGVVDAGESSPVKADTDGDGVGDMVETVLQTSGQHWVTDPTMTPSKGGLYYFVVPYSSNGSKAPIPTTSIVGIQTTNPGGAMGTGGNIYARASGGSVPVDLVNAFLSKITPNPSGGTDPVTGNVCATFSGSLLGDFYAGPKATPGPPDGINDSITGTAPGARYGFDVVPKANTSIAETASAQVYTVSFNAFGDESNVTYTLGSPVTLTFVVPPSPP